MHVRLLAGPALISTIAVAFSTLAITSPPAPAATVSASTPVDTMLADFQDPPAQFRPVYRYWHPGGRMDPATLRTDFRAMRAGGAGGVELANFVRNNSVAPIADYDADTEGFGTPAWRERFTDAVRIGREEGLQVDSTYTSKYSANLSTVTPDGPGSEKELSLTHVQLAPGQAYDAALPRPTLPAPDVTRADLVSVRAYPCLSDCDAGTPEIDPKHSVALTKAVRDEKLSWQAPAGESSWVVIASWMHGTGQQVEGEETPGNSYLVDHFNPVGIQAVEDFWNDRVLDPQLRRELRKDGGSLFFDSLELNRNGEQLRHWTPDFLQEFRKRRGYDVEPYLPALALDTPEYDLPGSLGARVREDYRQTLNDLFRDEHVLPLKRFAHHLGMTLRGQPYSSWGPSFVDPMEIWSLLDVPEGEDRSFGGGARQSYIDTRGADAWRSLATAAHLSGADEVSTECCASFGRAHRITRQYLLSHVNQNFSVGVNHVVWHGWSHNAPGTAVSWPGWAGFGNNGVDDSYGPRNPTWADDTRINDYVARNQVVLRAGVPRTDVAIYHQKPGHSTDGVSGERYFTSPALEQRGYTYGFVNATLLARLRADDGVLAPDADRFRAMVVDQETAMSAQSADRILATARAGVPVVVVGTPPARAVGNVSTRADAAVSASFDALRARNNVRFVDDEDAVVGALDTLGVHPRAAFTDSDGLVGLQRDLGTATAYYWYNQSDHRAHPTVTLPGGQAPYVMDPWTGQVRPATDHTDDAEGSEVTLDVASGDAVILLTSARPVSGAQVAEAPVSTSADLPAAQSLDDWQLDVQSWHQGTGPQDTAITSLPTRSVSAGPDGVLPAWNQLPGLEPVSGVGSYHTTFDLSGPAGTSAYLDLGAVATTFRVEVNGHSLPPLDQIDTSHIDLGPWLRPGSNELTVTVATMLGNAIAGKGSDPYGLRGPVRLQPYVNQGGAEQ